MDNRFHDGCGIREEIQKIPADISACYRGYPDTDDCNACFLGIPVRLLRVHECAVILRDSVPEYRNPERKYQNAPRCEKKSGIRDLTNPEKYAII